MKLGGYTIQLHVESALVKCAALTINPYAGGKGGGGTRIGRGTHSTSNVVKRTAYKGRTGGQDGVCASPSQRSEGVETVLPPRPQKFVACAYTWHTTPVHGMKCGGRQVTAAQVDILVFMPLTQRREGIETPGQEERPPCLQSAPQPRSVRTISPLSFPGRPKAVTL